MRIEILNNGEMRRIHEASLAILEDTGIQIDHKKTLETLADAGAKVDIENTSYPGNSLTKWEMRARSAEVARRSNPEAGSIMFGAELPVSISGLSSGIVRS